MIMIIILQHLFYKVIVKLKGDIPTHRLTPDTSIQSVISKLAAIIIATTIINRSRTVPDPSPTDSKAAIGSSRESSR